MTGPDESETPTGLNRFKVSPPRSPREFHDAVECRGRLLAVAAHTPGQEGAVASWPPGTVLVLGRDQSAYSRTPLAIFDSLREMERQFTVVDGR